MSPLEAVLLLHIVLTLINLVGVNTINDTIWTLYNKLPFAPSHSAAKQISQMRRDILQVDDELRSTSAQDDFAKWARLRRRLDKMQEEYKTFTKSQRAAKSSFVFYLGGARILATYGFQFYIQIRFSRHAIFWLPKGWMPWVGEWIVSFPAAPRGAVSLQAWHLACKVVMGMIADAILATLALLRGQVRKRRGVETVPNSNIKQT